MRNWSVTVVFTLSVRSFIVVPFVWREVSMPQEWDYVKSLPEPTLR